MNRRNFDGILKIIGAISIIVTTILGIVEFAKLFRGDVKVIGSVSPYETPPFITAGYGNALKYGNALLRIAETKEVPQYVDLDSIEKQYRINWATERKYSKSYDKAIRSLHRNPLYMTDFNTLWNFKIKNETDKPVEELILDLKFDGYCSITTSDTTVSRFFHNKIELGKLNPSYDIYVTCWQRELSSVPYERYKDFKLAHVGGSTSISFPKEKSKFVRVLQQTHPAIYVLLILLILTAGYFIYKNYKKRSITLE